MACKNPKSLSLLCLCVIFFSVSACKTIPKAPDVFLPSARHAPLDTGATLYLFADVKEARSIIELLPIEELKNRQTAQLLDRTDFVAAALFPDESGRRLQLAAWGNYPSSQAGLVFSFDRNWQSRRSSSSQSYWYSPPGRLSVAMTSKQAFMLSLLIDTPTEPFAAAPGIEIPEGYADFRQSAPLSCWMENPGSIISGMMSQAGVPFSFNVQKLFVNIFILEDNQYEAVFRLRFENNSFARGFAALLGMASGFIQDNNLAKLFLANPPVQRGTDVDIKTASLSGEEMSLLLQMISLY
ncbi:MAG: hypothetical protein FWD28_10965 [Treponema sp.]|nr:hypothetical protein [Treponema sp.]